MEDNNLHRETEAINFPQIINKLWHKTWYEYSSDRQFHPECIVRHSGWEEQGQTLAIITRTAKWVREKSYVFWVSRVAIIQGNETFILIQSSIVLILWIESDQKKSIYWHFTARG